MPCSGIPTGSIRSRDFPSPTLGSLTRAEMVINEKTALEYALGDSLMGRRAAVIIKNVGVNACADPLLQASAQGLIGGVVLVAGDDPGGSRVADRPGLPVLW